MKKEYIHVCDNCGVLFAKWGSAVKKEKGMNYLCERCFNPGFKDGK